MRHAWSPATYDLKTQTTRLLCAVCLTTIYMHPQHASVYFDGSGQLVETMPPCVWEAPRRPGGG